jgi:D-glycero-D-manno-heptose 1,7-bisphosphate phosphatase
MTWGGPAPAPRLIVFDADGTLRWTIRPGQQCPHEPGEWRLMPNVQETLRAMTWGRGGTALAIASNQNAVALGHLSASTAYRMLEATVREAFGGLPEGTAIEMCIDPPTADCECRKPAPGMLRRAMTRQAVAPADTLFVGDLDIDREAAARAGVRFAWARDFFGWPLP